MTTLHNWILIRKGDKRIALNKAERRFLKYMREGYSVFEDPFDPARHPCIRLQNKKTGVFTITWKNDNEDRIKRLIERGAEIVDDLWEAKWSNGGVRAVLGGADERKIAHNEGDIPVEAERDSEDKRALPED